MQDGKSNWLEGLILMCKTCAKPDKTHSDILLKVFMSSLHLLSGTILVIPVSQSRYPVHYITNLKQLPHRNLHSSFVDEFSIVTSITSGQPWCDLCNM